MPIRLANNCLLTRVGLMSLILTSAVTTAAAQSADPSRLLTLEEMQSGFVAAPIFKLTEVDGEIGTLAGFRLGELTDGRVFIGGAANWLVSGSSDVDLAYGGGLVEWFSHPDAPVQASVGSLVGIGSASLNTVVDVGGPDSRWRLSRGRFGFHGRPGTSSTAIFRFRESFFVAEPQASLILNGTDWFRVGLGVGYRFIGGASGFEDRLRGYTAHIGFHFGPS